MFQKLNLKEWKDFQNYVFAEVNNIKMETRRGREDVIDFFNGNPDGPLQHITDKLIEASAKPKIMVIVQVLVFKLRLAISNWYKRKYDVDF